MRIHILQHVPFEDEANLGVWARNSGHTTTKTLMYQNSQLPTMDGFDFLLILGGPMSINDEAELPWLIAEKKFIRKAIDENKIVLGICLGAQLIANVLGSKVYKNSHKEVGWFDVILTKEADSSFIFNRLPKTFTAFHWHGETFDLPNGCVRIGESEGCRNQAFQYKSRVIGLQFHLESSAQSIERLIQNCPEDLVPGKYVQGINALVPASDNLFQIQRVLKSLLKALDPQ